jgi:hypothetical protein
MKLQLAFIGLLLYSERKILRDGVLLLSEEWLKGRQSLSKTKPFLSFHPMYVHPAMPEKEPG